MLHTYVYQFYVMDEGWEMFPTVQETIATLSKHIDDTSSVAGDFLLIDFMEFRERAVKSAEKADVVRGFSMPIRVMPLVDNFRPSYALAWKAAKGGWCVVVSQVRLPWIEGIESHTLKIIEHIWIEGIESHTLKIIEHI